MRLNLYPIYTLLVPFFLGACRSDNPVSDCYTCKTETVAERPNQAIERETSNDDVCGNDAMETYKRKNTFETTNTMPGLELRFKSVATCTRKP